MSSKAIKMDWDACLYSGMLLIIASVIGGILFKFEGDSRWLIASIVGVLNVIVGALWTTVATLCRELLTAMAMAALLAWGFIGISIVADSETTFMEMMHAALEDGAIVVAGLIAIISRSLSSRAIV